MRNLLLLFSKYGTLILFIILEVISLFLIINYNNKQKEIFLYSSNLLSGEILQRYNASMDYFSLRTLNDSILIENSHYLELLHNKSGNIELPDENADSIFQKYKFIPARISSKTIHKRNNRMTLDKGTANGIEEGMGVISEKGIVGIVKSANRKFSSVIPVINTQLQISAKIKNKDYFGDLSWEPYDERYLILNHVPKHAPVENGDTIITSGYSTIFPPGIEIGRIEKISLPAGSNYFKIDIRLVNELANMGHVYVIENKLKDLETEILEEF